MQEPLKGILDGILRTLEKATPELAADIMDRGIVLTGGGALLKGLDRLISVTAQVPVHIAENPMLCVAQGCGRVLEEIARPQESNWATLLGFKHLP